MRITLSIPRSIVQYMDEVGVPMQERAELYERFVSYATGLMTGDELDRFESYASDHESEYASESRSMTFESFIAINEKTRNSLKELVGKDDDEELDLDDARRIGKKVSKMTGDDRKKFVGIINFMGASCRIYNEIWANYKPVDPERKDSNKGKAFRGEKPQA
jgi:hypothetical protein